MLLTRKEELLDSWLDYRQYCKTAMDQTRNLARAIHWQKEFAIADAEIDRRLAEINYPLSPWLDLFNAKSE